MTKSDTYRKLEVEPSKDVDHGYDFYYLGYHSSKSQNDKREHEDSAIRINFTQVIIIHIFKVAVKILELPEEECFALLYILILPHVEVCLIRIIHHRLEHEYYDEAGQE